MMNWFGLAMDTKKLKIALKSKKGKNPLMQIITDYFNSNCRCDPILS